MSFKALTPESSCAKSFNLYSSFCLNASNLALSSLERYLSKGISEASTFKMFSASSR